MVSPMATKTLSSDSEFRAGGTSARGKLLLFFYRGIISFQLGKAKGVILMVTDCGPVLPPGPVQVKV